jgi:hypothetical protein
LVQRRSRAHRITPARDGEQHDHEAKRSPHDVTIHPCGPKGRARSRTRSDCEHPTPRAAPKRRVPRHAAITPSIVACR